MIEAIMAGVLAMVCIALWVWRTNRRIKDEYRDRYDALNRRVGGILPPYDEVRK